MDEKITGHGHEHNGGCGCGGHSHEHNEGCGCGGHSHEHGEGFGCGGHNHEHGEGCGCGAHHEPDYENGLSIAENNVLMALSERGALPVAQFSLTSSREAQAYAVAMEPVYVARAEDSLEDIREYGALFAGLEEKGLIDIDYDFPLPGYPYREYHASGAWRRFVETAAEAKARGFTYDTPKLELGAITLTQRGEETVDGMFA